MTASPELTGGSGFAFEDGVTATYLTSALVGGGVRGLQEHVTTQVLVQRAAVGHPLDDLIVVGEDRFGGHATLSLQVKQSLTLSAAATNAFFRDVIRRCWATFKGPSFVTGHDRIGAATARIAMDALRDARVTTDWARMSVSHDDFFSRLSVEGFASDGQRLCGDRPRADSRGR